MRVHIICRNVHKARVLSRLASQLAKATRWTVGDTPDRKANVNYFFPYLEDDGHFKSTPTAAWFTHQDIFVKGKVDIWERVARRVTLRLTSTQLNVEALSSYGPTVYVTPYLDTVKFLPAQVHHSGKPVVGTSGYTYSGGRKGEKLLGRLERERPDIYVTAAGRGWPIQDCQEYQWDNLERFYQGLDVYVCTSLVEGVPMGPLEALACGKRVLIPIGVGLLDELPDVSGIVRYQAGDYGSLVRGLNELLDIEPDPKLLRSVVENRFMLNAWRQSHEVAFENLLWPPREVGMQSNWREHAGMFLVAYGKPARDCAVRCIKSFKKHHPDVPVMLGAASPLGAGEDLFKPIQDKDIGGRQAKLTVDIATPKDWQYVLYLDADQEVMEPLDFLFDTLVSGWEFVICKDMADRVLLSGHLRGNNGPEHEVTVKQVGTDQVLQYNGGMFAYRRCDQTKRFFQTWNEEYQKWLQRDQGALVRAFYKCPMRTFVLCNQWNASDRYPLPPGPIAVVHHNVQARRWKHKKEVGRIDSPAAWALIEEAGYRKETV